MRSNHTIPVVNRKEPLILGLGDFLLMTFSLWSALVLRYGRMPSMGLLEQHATPFLIIFIISIVSFYVAGLYGRSIHFTRSSLPGIVIRAQIANGLIAVFILYFYPNFLVTPKINLLVYVFLSSLFIILWRLNTYPLLSLRRKSPAVVIGSSPEATELVHEMKYNPRIGLFCRAQLKTDDTKESILATIENNQDDFQYIIADLDDPRIESILPELYRNFFAKVSIIDLHELYEEIFDRIPLSRMDHAWIMSAVSSVSPKFYDLMKRLFDIVLGVTVGAATCVVYPFVALAIKLEDKGPVFIFQERVGKNGKIIRIPKFRSMQRNEDGVWVKEGKSTNQVTRVGRFIRASRIDELPQALSIIRGHMSLIGPRPDVSGLAERLEKEIPYYSVRTIIAPGLTGWAQISQEKPPQSVEETKIRLSYDLYYITHRSLSLDLRIALRTLKTLLSRVGN